MRLLPYKVEAIMEINVPTKVRDLHRFLGIFDYYRDMWCKSAHTLADLKQLCLIKVEFKWTDVENNAYISVNKIVGRDVPAYYPKFTEIFIICTDTSKTQLGGVIFQN